MKQFYIAFLVLVFHFGHAAEVLPPAATISGPTAVCQNATGQVITFTGSGGTRPYTFTYTINGVLQPAAVTSASSNSVTVSIVTSTPGTFTYNLVSVHDNVTVTEQPINGQSVVVVITAAPTVDFSFNNDSTCSGTLIQFTSSVLGSGSYTYSWDFGDGSSLSPLANPTHSFTSLGCAILPFTVTLTVTAGGCTVTRTHTVSVKQKPDISFADPNATSASTEFSNCSVASLTNTVYSITVQNTSASSCISSYSINWGDNIIENNASFPISHTYTQLGVYNMVISATGSNGCSNSVTYIVKNISNPSAGVLNPGGTVDMCIPTPIIQYTIGNWAQNSPGTTYAINYGDGSPIVNLNQATMVASAYYNASNPLLSSNYPIPYSYTTNSCPGGDFIITLTVTNACRSTVGTVVGGNTRSKPLANFTNPTAACITSNVLFNNTTTLGYDSGCVSSTRFTWDFGDPASGTNNSIVTGWVTSAPNVNHTFSSTGVFTVTLTAQNGCGTTTKTQTICIEPPLVPLFSSPATGCASFNFTTTNNTIETNQCVPANYNWQVTYAVGNCGTSITPITDQTTTDGHFTFTEGGTYTIRLTASNSCPSQSVTQNVVVTKPPIVTAINGIMANYCGSASISPTANVTPCSSSGTLNYVWSFPGGVPVNPANLTTANPGTVNYASPGNYTVSVIVSNECGPSNTQTFSFNVNAAPVITNTSLSQSICSGTSTTSVILTASPSGTAFTWTAAATAGITGFLPGGTDTIPAQIITTSNTSQGTVTYTIIPTFNGCTGTTVNYSVIVNPAPEVTFSPAPQTICSGDNTAVVTLNSIASGTTFNWSATQPLGVTGVATSGTNTIPAQTLTNSTNIPIIITYNATATTSGSSSCAGAIYPYNITVKPKPSITESFTASTCSGSQFTVIPSNSALNTIPMSTTYSWPAPVTSVVMAGAIANNNEASIFGTVTNPTDIDQTATYTVTPSTNGCNGTPFTVTVTIHPVPTAANINPPAICSGDTFLVIPANGAGNNIPVGTTYTWTVSVNTNVTGQSSSNAPGVTSISQILTNTSNSNQTLNYTVTPAFGSCSGSTFVIYIIVRPKPQINIIASPQICSGDAFTVIPVNGSGNIVPNNTTYTWGIPISNPVGAVSGGSDQNTTQTNISQSLTNNTSAPATLTYNVMPTANGCIGNPFQIIVTVNPIPQAMVLTNQLYCNGASTMGIPFTNSVAGTTYTWTNSNPSIGLASSGTGDIPAFTSINTTNASTTATITVIASANGCSAPSQSFTITVNPAPTVLFSPSPQTLCSGTTSSIVTLSSTIIGATFSWTASQPLGITGVATNGTDTIPAQTLINSTDTPITITYNAVATTSSGSTCPGASYNYTITVNPNPTITEAFTATICSDGNFQVTPITSSLNSIPSGTTYSWAIPTVTGGITGGTAGINQASINGTLQNPTDVAQTATYSITPSVNGCPGQSFSLIVTINPKPTIANLSLPAICSNDTFSVTPVNGGSNIIPAGTTYTWTVALNNNITGQSDSGLIGLATISQTLTNNTSVNQSLIYTVTPLSGSCSGSNFTNNSNCKSETECYRYNSFSNLFW